MYHSYQQLQILERPFKWHHDLKLIDFLGPVDRPDDYEQLSVRQPMNVLHYIETYHQRINATAQPYEKASPFATCDAGRDPNLAFGSALVFDGLDTL